MKQDIMEKIRMTLIEVDMLIARLELKHKKKGRQNENTV